MIEQIQQLLKELDREKKRVVINTVTYEKHKEELDKLTGVLFFPNDFCEPDKLFVMPSEIEMEDILKGELNGAK